MSYQYSDNDIIGRGGMGCVYKGRDSAGNPVAIKMMSNQVTCYPEYRELFQSEVNALRRMNHPSVVHIVGEPFRDNAGNLFLPMEYVHGKTIEQYVLQHGPMTCDQATNLMKMILDAIQYIHNHECIHRDIKPSNIMIRDDGRICIIDFGIAKDSKIGSSGKTVGRIIGTDGYMSPEQANGLNIDQRTDIYSLGCVLYFMLTGQHAIVTRENDYKTIQAILNTEMPVPSHISTGISPKLDQVFLKAVNKNMTRRYQTAAEFKRDLSNESQLSPDLPIVPTVTVGSSSENDIVIANQYVSKHHLIIRGKETNAAAPNNGTQSHAIIEIEDISRNGTGMNGRRLHHSTATIDFIGTHDLPQIMLAGRPDCVLNWGDITSHLRTQGWKTTTSLPVPQPKHENLGVGFIIISFLVPIIGWIIWGIWKDEHPREASQAAMLAWAGFIINFITTIILLNS